MARLVAKYGSRLRPYRIFVRLLACTRFRIVTPRPSTFSKKCHLGSKFTVRALLCALSASFRFRLSYFKRPSRRSFARANSASFKDQKLIAETPNAGLALCSPFCLHKKSQLDVIATQRRQKNVAQLLAMAVRAELLSDDWVAFVDALSVEANRAHFLDGNVTEKKNFLDGSAGFPSKKKKKKKKKKRAISPPEVILPSFKRAISLPEVVLPKKRFLQGNIGQSGPIFRASDWSS